MDTSRSKERTPSRLMPILLIAALIVLVAACGAAPTPTPQPTPTLVPPTPTFTAEEKIAKTSYATHLAPILQKNCTRCHSGASPAAGLNLTSYAGIMKGTNVGAIVQWGPYSSALYQVLPRGTMPQGAAQLSDSDVQMIAAWIVAGAPDN